MLDHIMRPVINRPLSRMAGYLAARGVTANMMTAFGFVLALCCFAALAFQFYGAALVLILLNRLADGLDGAIARETKMTDFGGFLDIVSDFIFYAGTVFFFAIGRPEDALIAGFLLFSFFATGVSFLAYAIVAAKHGKTTEKRGKKSFFHIGGLAEGTETIIFLVLICLLPQYFFWLALIFGIMCWITAAFRVLQAREDFMV